MIVHIALEQPVCDKLQAIFRTRREYARELLFEAIVQRIDGQAIDAYIGYPALQYRRKADGLLQEITSELTTTAHSQCIQHSLSYPGTCCPVDVV
ncbi:MAG: hypothetical protein J7578_17785 [Chitinophagaceae bacterium]|nr:hypothetical protein [Chitinophagaceae bacterium]